MENPVFELLTAPIFIVLVLVALAAFIVSRFAPSPTAKRSRSKSDPLVTAVLGDRAKADRLMSYELKRAPGITQEEARRRALDRLTDDRT